MKARTDLVLVSFLEDQPEGQSFVRSRHRGWPLHVTIFPWFGVDDFASLDHKLVAMAERHQPFSFEVGPEVMFGENQDIPVNIVQDQTILKGLHEEFGTIIGPDAQLFESQWVGENYRAHITKHDYDDNRVPGETLTIDHLYLVKMLDDDHIQFYKKYLLGAGDETAA